MFYTKLIIQALDNVSLQEKYFAFLNKRWDFVPATTSGGVVAHREGADGEWYPNPDYASYNSATSKARMDAINPADLPGFAVGLTWFEEVRGWESAAIAQDFVTAVQALNLAGVTISYEGDTDPTAV